MPGEDHRNSPPGWTLQQRLDGSRVAVFDVLQAALATSEFDAVVFFTCCQSKESAEPRLRVRTLAEASGCGIAATLGIGAGDEVPVESTFEADVLALRAPVVVPEAKTDPHFASRTKGVVGAYLGVPVLSPDDRLVGVLAAYSTEARVIPKALVLAFKAFARALAAESEGGAAIEAVLAGNPSPWDLVCALARLGPGSFVGPEGKVDESVGDAAKILATLVGLDVPKLVSDSWEAGAPGVDDRDRIQRHNEWPAPVDDVVARAGELLPSLPGARIDVYPRSRGARAAVDLLTLERIVANLLLNAWRSAPPGTAIVVESLSTSEGTVEVAVEDKSGLAPVESLAGRLHPAGSRRIGLPIARALVEEAGGKLVQVPTGEGRRYVARLPAVGPSGSSSRRTRDAQDSAAARQGGSLRARAVDNFEADSGGRPLDAKGA